MPTIQETIQKVREFVDLPQGWHFGDGMPPSQSRADDAITFLRVAGLNGIERANAFPGIRGQVEITFYNADRLLEITIEPDDSITIAEDHGYDQVYFEEYCSKSDVYQKLEEFSQNLWAFSDLFTVNTMTQNVKFTRVSASQVPLLTFMVKSPFPSSNLIVQETKATPYVLILLGTTMSNLEIPTFTGQYEMFPQDAGLKRRRLPVGMSAIATSTIGDGRLFAKRLRP